jgi:hypothetical protein
MILYGTIFRERKSLMHSALATMEATEKASLDLENIWLKKRRKSRQIFVMKFTSRSTSYFFYAQDFGPMRNF